MNFTLSDTEKDSVEWWKSLLKEVLNVEDLTGSFSYEFFPTGIGTAITVKYIHIDDYEFAKDITDYEHW